MSKHQPGPWKCAATGLARSGMPEYEIHWSDAGECVAEVVHGEANARLIAAAPELLEACQAALSYGNQGDHPEHGSVNTMLRSAIAKAKGEQ